MEKNHATCELKKGGFRICVSIIPELDSGKRYPPASRFLLAASWGERQNRMPDRKAVFRNFSVIWTGLEVKPLYAFELTTIHWPSNLASPIIRSEEAQKQKLLLASLLGSYSQFYLSFREFEIVNARVHNLSWTHFRRLKKSRIPLNRNIGWMDRDEQGWTGWTWLPTAP